MRGPRFVVLPLLVLALAVSAQAAPPTCSGARVDLSEEYAFLVGSAVYADPDGDAEGASTCRFLADGAEVETGLVGELLHLPFDGSAAGSGGDQPVLASGVGFAAGRWGQALRLADHGTLAFSREGNLDLAEGTVEMWVALRRDGTDPVYASGWQVLLDYSAPGGDYVVIAISGDSGVIYAGGETGGEWQSAYAGAASTRSWRAGEWHHVAYTYSAAGSFMRFSLDGVLVADTNEGHYLPPASDGPAVLVGGDQWGNAALVLIDELRLSGRVADGEEIAARAGRREAPRSDEVWLASSAVAPGQAVEFELTPADAGGPGAPCTSAPRVYPGIPLFDPQPPSTLLPPGTTSLELAVRSIVPTTCRWSVGRVLPFAQMTLFDTGAGTTQHQTAVTGLDGGPAVVNDVYVRCADYPDFLLHLRYRCLPKPSPRFPRTGNLWGEWEYYANGGLEHMARVDLWLGANGLSAGQIRTLRQLNPDTRVLTSINAVENDGLPDDYYLKDIDGHLIEVWPGSYRLNLTRPYVAEYQGRLAARLILDSDLAFDGCFFDNVMTTQSWLHFDIYGNPVHIDADGDGVEDDPAVLDAAWKAGVFHELEVFRSLMPHALMSGHSMDIFEPGIGSIFNGISIGFESANVVEGEERFLDLWEELNAWQEQALAPNASMVESSPIDLFAYGYDYDPLSKVPPSSLAFARDYYPWMRFGLALTLMTDGYFAHEWGDTYHGNDWWYDELDFDLGYPLGPARFLPLDGPHGDNLIVNGGFEEPLAPPWGLWFDADTGCAASVTRDTTSAAEGTASARVDVTATSGADWQVELAQDDRSLEQGKGYDLLFWAKGSAPRPITLSCSKGSPDWDNYGLWREVSLTTDWQQYRVTFEATATASDARVQFLLGASTGSVWLDGVELRRRPPDILRRDFTHGSVLLNATRTERTIPLEAGFSRIVGAQAPRLQTVLDDVGPDFTTTGAWSEETLDSGEWQAVGPFFHNWGGSCHLTAAGGQASWALPVPEPDTYTVEAWWPAAPQAPGWSSAALFEVLAGGQVVASATADQRQDGDQWHAVGTVELSPADGAFVRLTCPGGQTCVADALYLHSEARYNDGAPVSSITLAPMDGIVLEWTNPLPADVNRDGRVDALDILAIVHAIFGEPTPLEVDVTGDGAVDAADVAAAVAGG